MEAARSTSAVICGKIGGEGKRDLGPKGRQSLARGASPWTTYASREIQPCKGESHCRPSRGSIPLDRFTSRGSRPWLLAAAPAGASGHDRANGQLGAFRGSGICPGMPGRACQAQVAIGDLASCELASAATENSSRKIGNTGLVRRTKMQFVAAPSF